MNDVITTQLKQALADWEARIPAPPVQHRRPT